MNRLYPRISPFAVHRVGVGDGHIVHVEECGNSDAPVVLFLHGGPGSGCNADHRRYFDPGSYRIVLVDQRGCGRSTPPGGVCANTTDQLVQDLEIIRRRLDIERWLLFGGSWGATLALAYAQRHGDPVSAMILRGTFLARAKDLAWFFGADGVARVFPDAYVDLLQLVPSAERHDLIGAYHRRVHGGDEEVAFEWARAWSSWADRIATWTLPPSQEQGQQDDPGAHATAENVSRGYKDRFHHPRPHPEGDKERARRDFNGSRQRLLAKVRIETHYAVHGYFLGNCPLLDGVVRLPDVPVTIVHGRRDLVCPVEAAWTLNRAIPGSRLILLPDAGHLAVEPAMVDALVGETNRFR